MMKKTLVLLIISAMIVSYFSLSRSDKKSNFQIFIVERKNIAQLKNFNGNIQSDFNVQISSSVNGRLKTAFYRKSDQVVQGDILFDIDSSEQTNLLSELLLNEEKAERLINRLHTEYLNAREMLAVGGISEVSMEDISFELKQAKSDLGIIHKQIERAEVTIEKYSIVAPFSGVIASIDVNESEFVRSGQVLGSITDTSRKKVRTYIDEFDGDFIKEGQKVRILSMEKNERIYIGQVSSVASIFESAQGLKKLEVTIMPEDDLKDLKIGQNVRLEVLVAEAADVPVIDRTLLFSELGEFYVKKLVDSQIVKVPVKLGVQNAYEVEITQGLKVGDRVILN